MNVSSILTEPLTETPSACDDDVQVSCPPAWSALHQIAGDLHAHGSFPTVPAQALDWTTVSVVDFYQRICGPDADLCRTLGWDVDLLLDPHPRLHLQLHSEYPHAVELSGDYIPPDVARLAYSTLPIQHIDQSTMWIPMSPPLIPALRDVVRAGLVRVDDSAARYLRDLQRIHEPPAVEVSTDGNNLHLTTTSGGQLWKTIPGARWVDKHQHFIASSIHALQAVRVADDHDLPVSPAARALASRATAPFSYDGTLEGLRTVPVRELVCVDEKTRDRFARAGITTIYDLITWIPLRYVDRSHYTSISSVRAGDVVAVRGTITRLDTYSKPRRTRMVLTDRTGTLELTFFNSTWQARRFTIGQEVLASGTATEWQGSHRRVLQLTNPLVDSWEENTDPFLPIYPQSGQAEVSTWNILSAIRETLIRLGSTLIDPVPEALRSRHGLVTRGEAFTRVHLPLLQDDIAAARRRIAYDELFRLQTSLLYAKLQHSHQPSTPLPVNGPVVSGFLESLPFTLTPEQGAAWDGIAHDLQQPTPMHRLLQGDVGSGKTMLAVLSAAAAVDAGRQAAVMAPTEILATQLFHEFTTRLSALRDPAGAPIRVELLTNKQRGKKRTSLLSDIADGNVHITVGTHALLDAAVVFRDLAVVVVDEQHRFGVEQRALLRDKPTNGHVPHTLVMTATPIPRTAAMTVFGDLDISTITALPPGRQPIRTTWLDAPVDLTDLGVDPWRQVRAEVAAGHQAYVVCPLVSESEKLQAANAERTHEDLLAHALQGLRVEVVHGQQKPEIREDVMARFAAGQVDVLVSTTVIEVGVNVPNASVMVILDPARFGIAQLHQLRGRVGRGSRASTCFLYGEASTAEGQQRLMALTQSTDGFYLSEVDLSIRGPGSLLGSAQSGTGKWIVADLSTDTRILRDAREDTVQVLKQDPTLQRWPALLQEVQRTLASDAMQWLHRS